MWHQLKNETLAWKLLAFVVLPTLMLFTCGLVGHTLYSAFNRLSQPAPSPVQQAAADVGTPTVPPMPEPTATLTPTAVSYELNWKIEDGQPIAYKTAMEVSITESSIDFGQVFNFGQLAEGDEAPPSPFEELFEDMEACEQNYSMVSILEKNPTGNISIEMFLDNVDCPEQAPDNSFAQGFGQLLSGMQGTAQLRGEISPEGEITSFYVAQQQKNLLALFFELPTKPVEVGDTWQIDLTCILLNSAQFIVENSDRVNEVKLAEIIETPTGEMVAVLEYRIAESVEGQQDIPFFTAAPVPSSMKCDFVGQGEFLIEEGRWKQFSAEYTIQSTGIITADVTQHLALTPLDEVPEYPEPDTQDRPTLSEIFSKTQETRICEYVSEDVIEPDEEATLTISSYIPADDKFGTSGTSVVLQLANINSPEEVGLNGEKFVLNPFEKMANEKPTSFPLDPDPNRPPEPVISLTLISSEEDIEGTITLNIEGNDYLLMLDDTMGEYCQK